MFCFVLSANLKRHLITHRQNLTYTIRRLFTTISMEIQLPESTKAIIFDLDGTLADTMPLHYQACQIVCNAKGFDFPLDYFIEKAGIPTIEVFEMLMKDLNLPHDGVALGQEKEAAVLTLVPTVKPIAPVYEFALAMKGKLPMAIGSGGQRITVDLTLQALDMIDFFDAVVSCDDVDHHKPHPDTFLAGALQMGVAPEGCVVLEDGDPGIEAAKKAGMNYIDIRTFYQVEYTV